MFYLETNAKIIKFSSGVLGNCLLGVNEPVRHRDDADLVLLFLGALRRLQFFQLLIDLFNVELQLQAVGHLRGASFCELSHELAFSFAGLDACL